VNSCSVFYETEQPRAVLVGWDTLDAPTYRHEAFEASSPAAFRRRALEQLDPAAGLVRPAVRQCQGAGYEADDFLARRCAGGARAERSRGER